MKIMIKKDPQFPAKVSNYKKVYLIKDKKEIYLFCIYRFGKYWETDAFDTSDEPWKNLDNVKHDALIYAKSLYGI